MNTSETRAGGCLARFIEPLGEDGIRISVCPSVVGTVVQANYGLRLGKLEMDKDD